ncbi:MAG TPA: MBOAT family protein [Planctomycetes bacterium]|nr:MBOAT family protein [Planctomycetota bacterium]
MLFVDFAFLPFFLTVLAVHWALPRNGPRKVWLLAASYAFYAAWDPRFLGLILLSTAVDYIAARRIVRSPRPRAWLLVSLVSNLGLLGFFKYFDFFVESAARFLTQLGFQAHPASLNLILPVGISFYTFQTLSYTIDVYRGRLTPVEHPLDLALFVAFFPQLVAGPIERASDFLPQLETPRRFEGVDVRGALVLFFLGFVKKACISDGLSPHIDAYFAHPASFDAASAWYATLAYATQIYCDFSGYSDMAIACAALLGYRLSRNFDHPYLAADITSFWRRWHISLSTWLRDYLYIPLGGNRGSRLFQTRNLMATMLLGGLWHGAGWNFVAWGGLHGLGLALHRVWSTRIRSTALVRRITGILGIPITFWFVCVGWVFFRAASFADAAEVLNGFVRFGPPASGAGSRVERLALLNLAPGLAWGLLAALAIAHVACYRRWLTRIWRRSPAWAFTAGLAVACALVLPFVPLAARPFIYFQF